MSYRKYLKDYSIEEYPDGQSAAGGGRGRVKTRAVYIAGYYAIRPEIPKPVKKALIALSAASWAAYIGALANTAGTARRAYITIPFTLAAFPLIFMTMAAVSLYRIKSLMTREQADKTAGRLPINSALATILSGAAFIAFVITAIASNGQPATDGEPAAAGDALFAVFSLATAAATAYIFAKCRKLEAYVVEAPGRNDGEIKKEES